jgi:hypothetical protein
MPRTPKVGRPPKRHTISISTDSNRQIMHLMAVSLLQYKKRIFPHHVITRLLAAQNVPDVIKKRLETESDKKIKETLEWVLQLYIEAIQKAGVQ